MSVPMFMCEQMSSHSKEGNRDYKRKVRKAARETLPDASKLKDMLSGRITATRNSHGIGQLLLEISRKLEARVRVRLFDIKGV